MFSGSSLWAENCVQSIYWELLRGYTFKEVWKANWSVCTMGTIEGSADPRVNSRARMAFQNCSKLGQATRPLNPCHRPIIGHISPGRWRDFGKQLEVAEGNTLERKSGHGASQSVCPLGSTGLPHTKIQHICCSYRQK